MEILYHLNKASHKGMRIADLFKEMRMYRYAFNKALTIAQRCHTITVNERKGVQITDRGRMLCSRYESFDRLAKSYGL